MAYVSEKAALFWDWRWLTTVLVFLLSYFVARFYLKVSKYPKGPLPLPIVGNIIALQNVDALYKLADDWSRKYGDPFTLWMGEKPMVVLNTHKVMKEAFVEKRDDFAGRLLTKMGRLQRQGSNNIVFEDFNPTWKVLRKVASTAVRKYAVSDSLATLCSDVVDAYVDSLKKGVNVVDARAPFTYIMYNVTGMSVYGAKFDKESQELVNLQASSRAFFEAAVNGLPSDIFPWLGPFYRGREEKMKLLFGEYFAILNNLYQQAVRSYVPGEITKNFTHSMLAARAEAIEQEKSDTQYLTEANMFQIIMDIFGAATDTSAATLIWVCLTMTRRPDIQARMKKEIETILGEGRPRLEDREKMPYTVSCLLEALRMYPVAPLGLPHKTSCDTQVGGRYIPKDTGILYNIYAINHDSHLWADPEVFRPERFLDAVTGKVNQELLPQLLTFGLGHRTCPGDKMALAQMFYILVRLMQRVECSAPAGTLNSNIPALHSALLFHPAEQDIVLTRVY